MIHEFSQFHTEPVWLADLKSSRLLTRWTNWICQLLSRLEFHRWNLGDGRISDSEPLIVCQILQLSKQSQVYQMGTQTVLEQLPAKLGRQGVVFTDFHTALEEIPVVEQHFMSAVKYDGTNWRLTIRPISTVVRFFMCRIMLRLTLIEIFIRIAKSDVPFNKSIF